MTDRRRVVGKKLVERVFYSPFDLTMQKMMTFSKNLRFAKDLSEKWKVFLRFVGKSVDKDRIVSYNVEYKLLLH